MGFLFKILLSIIVGMIFFPLGFLMLVLFIWEAVDARTEREMMEAKKNVECKSDR